MQKVSVTDSNTVEMGKPVKSLIVSFTMFSNYIFNSSPIQIFKLLTIFI